MNTSLLQELNIKLIDTEVSDSGSIKSQYEVQPLERGFGITMGNTLRRICLSHLEGTAVTSMKIAGATHEFATIDGVKEDTVEIILNCKTLVFQTELEEPFRLHAKVTGPCDLKASDLEVPAGVKLINPDVLLATITDTVDFEIELEASRGIGYVLANEQNTKNHSVDTIFTDSSFMPIKSFSYTVEPIKIGESSEASSNKFEKLVMNIESNGSIEIDKALAVAAKLLLQRFGPFMNLTGETLPVATAPTAMEIEEQEDDYSDIGIETLNLSVRSYNCLKRANKNNIKDLLNMTTEELMGIKNFGKKSAEEVIKILNEKGFYLLDDSRRSD